MFVEQSDDGWIVADHAGWRAGPFQTNAQAWSIDRHSDEGRGNTERYGRIRIALAMFQIDTNAIKAPAYRSKKRFDFGEISDQSKYQSRLTRSRR